jgi:hypothetical protein
LRKLCYLFFEVLKKVGICDGQVFYCFLQILFSSFFILLVFDKKKIVLFLIS